MGRELQKRKNRSSRPKVRVPNSRKKALNPMGNGIIAKNWDKTKTLTQNYRRLGLASRLQAPTGGSELSIAAAQAGLPQYQHTKNPASNDAPLERARISEARVERDASGKIVRVISAPSGEGSMAGVHKPLRDPLAKFDEDADEVEDVNKKVAETKWEDWNGLSDNEGGDSVVAQLVQASRKPMAKMTRFQSSEESQWLARLVAKHGDDVRAMAWDRKLNPYQQTVGDLSKRLKRWKAAQKE